MAKPKRKLTRTEKAARALRRATYMTVFMNGKQKQVPRESMIDGISQEEFIEENADPNWLHQNERWERIKPEPAEDDHFETVPDVPPGDGEILF